MVVCTHRRDILLSIFTGLLILPLVAFSQRSNTGNISEHHYIVEREYTTENGLPANGTNGMYQDSKGYIWAATYNGLVRYNGLEFKIYNSSSIGNLESNRFTAVSEDLDGNIWAGLEQDGFIKIDMDSDSVYNYSLDHQVSSTNIKTTSFNFTSDNTPWIGTSSGVFTIQDGEIVNLKKLPGKYVNRLLINNESIYVVYTDEIVRLNPDNLDDLLTIAELRNDVVYF
jgi:ligand-binding sensor domain-containing protein